MGFFSFITKPFKSVINFAKQAVSGVAKAVSTAASYVAKGVKAVGNFVSKAASAVGNFVKKHGKKILAGAMAAVGVGICVFSGGLLTPLGAGLLAGGLSGLAASFKKGGTWKDFGKAVLGGFIAGALTALAAPAIGLIAAKAAAVTTVPLLSTLITASVSAIGYAGVAVATNAINNKIHGQKWNEGWKTAALCGGMIGLISPAINSVKLNNTLNLIFKPLEESFGHAWLTSIATVGIRMGANIGLNAVMQRLSGEKVNWCKAIYEGAIYSFVNGRRANANLPSVDPPAPHVYNPQPKIVPARECESSGVPQKEPKPSNIEIPSPNYGAPRPSEPNVSESNAEATPERTPNAANQQSEQERPAETQGEQERPAETQGEQERPVETQGEQERPVEIQPQEQQAPMLRNIPADRMTTSQETHFHSATENSQRPAVISNATSSVPANRPENISSDRSENVVNNLPNNRHINLSGESVSRTILDSATENVRQQSGSNSVENHSIEPIHINEQPSTSLESTTRRNIDLNHSHEHKNNPRQAVEMPHQYTFENSEIQTLNAPRIPETVSEQASNSTQPLESNVSAQTSNESNRYQTRELPISERYEFVPEELQPDNQMLSEEMQSTSNFSRLKTSVTGILETVGISSKPDNERPLMSRGNVSGILNNLPFMKKSSNDDEPIFIYNLYEELRFKNYMKSKSIEAIKNISRRELEQFQRVTAPSGIKIGVSNSDRKNDQFQAYPSTSRMTENFKETFEYSEESTNLQTKIETSKNAHSSDKPGQLIKDSRKTVLTCPIIVYNPDTKAYAILHPDKWTISKFPKDLKIVTVAGTHGTGRTTFIHSLLYHWGYRISTNETITTSVRVGVMMYYLPEKKLAILDCCDSFDTTEVDDYQMPRILMELFCYIISDHRVHHTSIDPSTFNDPKEYQNYHRERMRLLQSLGEKINVQGGQNITTILRYTEMKQSSRDRVKQFKIQLRNDYEESTGFLFEASVNDGKPNEQLIEQAKKAYFDEDLFLLKVHPEPNEFDLESLGNFNQELEDVASRIENSTNSFEINESCVEVKDLICDTWILVSSKTHIHDELAQQINVFTASESNFDIQGFFEEVSHYAGQKEGEVLREVEQLFEEIKNESEQMKKSEKDQSPNQSENLIRVFRWVCKASDILLRSGLRESDTGTKNKEIGLALRGFTLFLQKYPDSDAFEITSIRMAINDFNNLSKLNHEEVYLVFHLSWLFLKCTAMYGFRLELLEFNIFDRVKKTFNKNTGQNDQESEAIRCESLNTLILLLSQDTSKFIENEPAPHLDESHKISNDEFCKLIALFCMKVDKLNEKIKNNKTMTAEEVKDHYAKMLDYPKNFFDSCELAKAKEMTFEDLIPPMAHYFTQAMLMTYCKNTAHHFANCILTNCDLFLPKNESNEKVFKRLLKVWGNIILLSKESQSLYEDICNKTDLKEWLLIELKKDSPKFYVELIDLANTLIYVDGFHKLDGKDPIYMSEKVHDLSSLRQRETRDSCRKAYGIFRWYLIDNGHLPIFLVNFFGANIRDKETMGTFIWHIERLLCYGVDKEDRDKCLGTILDQRHEIIGKLSEVFKEICDLTPQALGEYKNIIMGTIYFLDKILIYYHSTDVENYRANRVTAMSGVEWKEDRDTSVDDMFFHRRDEKFKSENGVHTLSPIKTTETKTWKNVMPIVGVVFRCIPKRRNKKDIFDEDTDMDLINEGAALQYFYNLALCSGITMNEIKAAKRKVDKKDVGELKDSYEPSPQEIFSYKSFRELDLEDPHVNDNIQRGAFINTNFARPSIASTSTSENSENRIENTGFYIKSYLVGDVKFLQDKFRECIDSLKEAHKNDEHIKSLMNQEEARQKRNLFSNVDDFDAKTIGTSSNRDTNVPFTSRASVNTQNQSIPIQLAIDNIYLECHGHDFIKGTEFSFAKDDHHQLYEKIKTAYGEIYALVFLFFIQNGVMIDEEGKIVSEYEHLLKYFNVLSDKIKNGITEHHVYKIPKEKERPKKFLSLKYVKEMFEYFEYEEFIDDENKNYLISDYSSLKPRLDEIEDLCNLLNVIGPLRVYTKLKDLIRVEDCSSEDFLAMRLPQPFFIQDSFANYGSLPINQLKTCPKKIKKTIFSGYVLLCINVNNMITYQGVFNSVQPVSSVIDNIKQAIHRDFGEDTHEVQLRSEENGEPLIGDQKLSEYGLLPAAFLYATFYL